MSDVTVLLVRSGGTRFALGLDHLVEVLDAETAVPVPAAEPALRGLMAVRGRLLPLVHLGAFVAGGTPPALQGDAVVLVRAGGREVCLELDEAETVVTAEVLAARGDARAAWSAGVIRDEAGLVPLLDVPALVARLTDSGDET